ncbi:MAG: Crp/Fnr family transcriptional regulator [Pseudomonadota bacterium]
MSSTLRAISLFHDLPDATLARVAAACSIRTYEKNAHILSEQEPTTDVFFVLSGTVRFSSHAPTGREVIYSEISSGSLFGEFAAVDGRPRSSDAVAITECRLARMPSAAFVDLLKREGSVAFRLIELLVGKVRLASERVYEASALAVRDRLRRELLRLAGSGARNGIEINPAPTHYEIAARIGSHREAVTRELDRLEAAGILDVSRRQLRILDLERLREDTDGSADQRKPTVTEPKEPKSAT